MLKFTRSIRCIHSATWQRGSALIVSLVFLLVMTLIGVAAMQGTTQQESMANNARQRNLAFQSAEAALRAGEAVLQNATLPTFDNTGTRLGLRQPVSPTINIGTFWLDEYCWVSGADCSSAESQVYPGTLSEVSEQPRYVVEELPRVTLPGGSVKFGALSDAGFYRITARSLGGVADAVVILQSTYRR